MCREQEMVPGTEGVPARQIGRQWHVRPDTPIRANLLIRRVAQGLPDDLRAESGLGDSDLAAVGRRPSGVDRLPPVRNFGRVPI